MTTNIDREDDERPKRSAIIPEDEIIIKFSFSSSQIDESYLSTLFRVKEMHAVTLVDSDDERVIITLTYLDPVEHPSIAKRFRVLISKETIRSNVSSFIQLYMESRVARELVEILKNADSVSIGTLNTAEIDGISIYLPKSQNDLYEYTDEHLCLQLDAFIFDGDFIKFTFFNYASIKREEDVMQIIKKMSQRPEIAEIQQKTHQLVSKLIEITDFNPDANLLFNTPMEMMEYYIGLKKLGNGFVEERKDRKLNITIDRDSLTRLASSMKKLLKNIP